MKMQISWIAAKGRRVDAIASSWFAEQVIITFRDNTFIVVDAKADRYGDIDITSQDFDPLEIGKEQVVRLGIMTEAEYTALKEKRADERQERFQEREKLHYLRLKEKYGER